MVLNLFDDPHTRTHTPHTHTHTLFQCQFLATQTRSTGLDSFFRRNQSPLRTKLSSKIPIPSFYWSTLPSSRYQSPSHWDLSVRTSSTLLRHIVIVRSRAGSRDRRFDHLTKSSTNQTTPIGVFSRSLVCRVLASSASTCTSHTISSQTRAIFLMQ